MGLKRISQRCPRCKCAWLARCLRTRNAGSHPVGGVPLRTVKRPAAAAGRFGLRLGANLIPPFGRDRTACVLRNALARMACRTRNAGCHPRWVPLLAASFDVKRPAAVAGIVLIRAAFANQNPELCSGPRCARPARRSRDACEPGTRLLIPTRPAKNKKGP